MLMVRRVSGAVCKESAASAAGAKIRDVQQSSRNPAGIRHKPSEPKVMRAAGVQRTRKGMKRAGSSRKEPREAYSRRVKEAK